MPLFYCTWPDLGSVLIDIEPGSAEVMRATASSRAKEITGKVPALVHAVPVGALAFQVYREEEDEPDGTPSMIVEAEPFAAKLMATLEEATGPVVATTCPAEALGERDQRVRCERAPDHAPPHRHGDLEW